MSSSAWMVRTILFAVALAIGASVGAGQAEAAPNAAIVMDMRNGHVYHARSADARRHPASLTKMMTLYLTFEAVRDGRLRLDQKVRVSRRAARQPASKLYLKAGQRVSIRSLIRATAIKSANDAAMVLAETIGGSKAGFGRMMTERAAELGMTGTRFKNPHGLTQSGHYSTARDMAILARQLHFDFPQYWNVFGRVSTYAAGKRIWNTNRLLRSYRGADGLKTGYTRAAGYNLAATAKRGDRHVIAIQMGASSSADRARRVARLLDMGFQRAPRSARRVEPAGAPRERVVVARAPVPSPRPGMPATGLAAVAEAFGPSEAEAATPATPEASVRRTASARANTSAYAPVRAETPVPRQRQGTAARSTRNGTSPVPIPVPRPTHLARKGDRAWAAEIGPFGSESAALSVLVDLPETAQAVVTKAGRDDGAAYAIRLPRSSRIEAVRACGTAGATDCRVIPGAGR